MWMLRERVTAVWLGLMALTVLTTWILSKDVVAPAAAVTGIFLMAATKVRFVMLDFMELRDAPVLVRAVFEAWIVVLTGLILGFWFLTT
ncbi:cytochrome C oxidase subunit IV family protein [Mycobacterium sp. CVI_P3]|uniref:Cytochrome C oxidase subunit IV family protein n=1 Tax=Mycobacterium pinniadriaticum TaxID=2994102 RepID=A0ABT3SIS7_9MYCO|nr:cytochrome C oxidase subunit IV family protein [Mycobacterium pinniadriaticum]MCX2932373.1 cytochrome C oxidase subunit IV family protein [Mycobacterium pinniadriaticum]MCX2938770.1 cytochrome C oxidase subunit IV family protein [Mycobacterium pinniadriaticum]